VASVQKQRHRFPMLRLIDFTANVDALISKEERWQIRLKVHVRDNGNRSKYLHRRCIPVYILWTQAIATDRAASERQSSGQYRQLQARVHTMYTNQIESRSRSE
jgi:hypothetical protein